MDPGSFIDYSFTLERYCQKLWMGLAQAASFLMPSTKGTPLMTSTIN